jgi:repressor LexA
MSRKLTSRQTEVLDFIKSFIDEHEFPPTVRELSDHFSISVKGGYDHIKALEKKGLIHCDPNKSRSIKVMSGELAPATGIETVRVPILGHVQAGLPVLAEDNWQGTVDLPARMYRGEVFALEVHGESMKDAGILENDLAIIRVQESFNDGEIVVARTEDGVTLKRAYRQSDHIELRPENDAFESIRTPDVSIVGRMVGLIRQYA